MAGFWKTDQNHTWPNCTFLAQLIAMLIPYPCTVALTLTGLADWSAFIERILLTM